MSSGSTASRKWPGQKVQIPSPGVILPYIQEAPDSEGTWGQQSKTKQEGQSRRKHLTILSPQWTGGHQAGIVVTANDFDLSIFNVWNGCFIFYMQFTCVHKAYRQHTSFIHINAQIMLKTVYILQDCSTWGNRKLCKTRLSTYKGEPKFKEGFLSWTVRDKNFRSISSFGGSLLLFKNKGKYHLYLDSLVQTNKHLLLKSSTDMLSDKLLCVCMCGSPSLQTVVLWKLTRNASVKCLPASSGASFHVKGIYLSKRSTW